MKPTINTINPILILEQIPGSDTSDDPNVYGYETIRVWVFNFDGWGTALVSYDDDAELNSISGEDLDYILLGNPGSGHRWYRPTTHNLADFLNN
jgi:hypothetical protein